MFGKVKRGHEMDINLNDGLVSILTIYELQNDKENHKSLDQRTNSNGINAERHINKQENRSEKALTAVWTDLASFFIVGILLYLNVSEKKNAKNF